VNVTLALARDTCRKIVLKLMALKSLCSEKIGSFRRYSFIEYIEVAGPFRKPVAFLQHQPSGRPAQIGGQAEILKPNFVNFSSQNQLLGKATCVSYAKMTREKSSPTKYWEKPATATKIASKLYRSRKISLDKTPEKHITVVCILDTHNQQLELPDGDLLVHAGDLSKRGTLPELQAQLDWANSQKHTRKVVIAGNYDRLLDPSLLNSILVCSPKTRSSLI